MDDFAEKISALLSNPESLEKVKSIASMISNNNAETPANDLLDSQAPNKNESPDGLDSLLGNIDPALLLKLTSMLSGGHDKNDPKVHLLTSLRPFLGEERRNSLDTALNLLKFSKIALLFTDGFGKKE